MISMNNDEHVLFEELVRIILMRGVMFPKEHGNWARLRIGDDEYLCMDTWSQAIHLKKNADYNNKWTGFDGEEILYLGMNFGGLEIHVNANYLENLLKEIKL
jgi:hypothetical protein